MLISYYANKKSSPRLPSLQPSLIFFNIPIESGSTIKPCTLKHFQVTYMLHKAGYWTIPSKQENHRCDILSWLALSVWEAVKTSLGWRPAPPVDVLLGGQTL